MAKPNKTSTAAIVDVVREYLANDSDRIRLHGAMSSAFNETVELFGGDRFSASVPWTDDAFRARVAAYDELVGGLCVAEGLVAWWGGPGSRQALLVGLRRMCDSFGTGGGLSGWLALRWYPVALLAYAAGVAAVAAGRYDTLWTLLDAWIAATGSEERPLVVVVPNGLDQIPARFKALPGLQGHHTPLSDHLFELLRKHFDAMSLVGSEFERAFDRFEVLWALEYLHRTDRGWCPIGRFGWKSDRLTSAGPLAVAIAEATRAEDGWPPLREGFFDGSHDRVKALAEQLRDFVARCGWY